MKLKWKPDPDSDRAEGLMFKAAKGHVLRCTPKAERWAFECTCGWRAVHRHDGPALKHAEQVAPPTIFDILRTWGEVAVLVVMAMLMVVYYVVVMLPFTFVHWYFTERDAMTYDEYCRREELRALHMDEKEAQRRRTEQ